MSINRSFIIPAILLAASTPFTGAAAQESIKPTNGPWASLYVNYSGGWASRDLNATVSVDRDAYVLVGHLGGTGEMTILYPSSPTDNGFVRANTRVRTDYFDAAYDGTPAQFAFRSPQRRHSGARLDSYDGQGYVFVITSDRPMNFQRFAEGGDWQAMYVENFFSTNDPRWAVHQFADLVAGDDQYRLRFASGTQSMYATRYASMASDCSYFMHLGITPLAAAYFMGGMTTAQYFWMVNTGYYQSSLCTPYSYSNWGWSNAAWSRGYAPRGYYRPVSRHLASTLPMVEREERRASSGRGILAVERAPVITDRRAASDDASDEVVPITRRTRPTRITPVDGVEERRRTTRPERATTTERPVTPERRTTRATERARPTRPSARTTERRTTTTKPAPTRSTSSGSGRATKPRPSGDQR